MQALKLGLRVMDETSTAGLGAQARACMLCWRQGPPEGRMGVGLGPRQGRSGFVLLSPLERRINYSVCLILFSYLAVLGLRCGM